MVRCDSSNTLWSIRHPVGPHGSKDQWNSCSRRVPSKPTLGPPHQWLRGEITGRPWYGHAHNTVSILFFFLPLVLSPLYHLRPQGNRRTHDVDISQSDPWRPVILNVRFYCNGGAHRDEGHSGHSRTLSTDELHPKNTLHNAVYLLNETDCVQSQSNKRERQCNWDTALMTFRGTQQNLGH